jgi:hypothetical protein
MNSIDGVARLHMSGTRAVLVLAPGAELDELAVAAAFSSRGMKLESIEPCPVPQPRAAYAIDSGVT